MGEFLTFRGSAKANATTGALPDENYAREVMQLFTIGLVQLNLDGTPQLSGGSTTDTYSQDDITGLARVFTGWDFDFAGLTGGRGHRHARLHAPPDGAGGEPLRDRREDLSRHHDCGRHRLRRKA